LNENKEGAGEGTAAMTALIRNPKDFWTGLVFIAFGIGFLAIAMGYPIGSARRMGPAYFPTILSVVLILIGLGAAARGILTRGVPVTAFALKPMMLVTLGTVVFGFLIRDAGLVVSIVLLVMISAYSSAHFNWKTAALLAIGMSIFCVIIFVKGLGLSIPIVGPLLGGG
jgi:Tripartite tricarboxylate transporter TctB family